MLCSAPKMLPPRSLNSLGHTRTPARLSSIFVCSMKWSPITGFRLLHSCSKIQNLSFPGDVVGPSFFVPRLNAENLMRRPYGCGEQDMFNFATNLYNLKFLKVCLHSFFTPLLQGTHPKSHVPFQHFHFPPFPMCALQFSRSYFFLFCRLYFVW